MFSMVVLSVIGRFAIHFRLRKKPGLDDFFLVVAFIALLTSIAIIQARCFDILYIVYAVNHSVTVPRKDLISIGLYSMPWTLAANISGWITICATKFCFLYFFKRLIDRIKSLNIYWWFALAFNVCVFGFGLSVYYLTCPFLYDARFGETAKAYL